MRVHAGVTESRSSDRDIVLDALLGPGAQIRSGGVERPGGTVIGGIGLPWLRDLDFGTNWLARASELDWPEDVLLEDFSYSGHRVMHRMQELAPVKVVLLGCMPRDVDAPGTIRQYRLNETTMPDDEEVHDRLAESVGGVIDLDHTLAICRYWNALPDDTTVIEVEPARRDFGWEFSDPVEAAVADVLDRIRREIGI